MKFEWDADKAKLNLIKHGVSFEECLEVFDDSFALDLFDKEHSDFKKDSISSVAQIMEFYL